MITTVGLLVCLGCQPQEAPASLCRGLSGSWFSDASGETALTDDVTPVGTAGLPLRGSDGRFPRLSCNVFHDGKVVAWFDAEVGEPAEIRDLQRSLEESADQWDFEAGGGRGGLSTKSKGSELGTEAFWTCKNTKLKVGVKRFADNDEKLDLTKQLAERIAGTTGCLS